jgi:hypothetical protein
VPTDFYISITSTDGTIVDQLLALYDYYNDGDVIAFSTSDPANGAYGDAPTVFSLTATGELHSGDSYYAEQDVPETFESVFFYDPTDIETDGFEELVCAIDPTTLELTCSVQGNTVFYYCTSYPADDSDNGFGFTIGIPDGGDPPGRCPVVTATVVAAD